MRIVISGSSGLIGSALVPALAGAGHEVVKLVRREPAAPDERRWDPLGAPDPVTVDGFDAVIHLAGAGVGDKRWTAEYRRVIRDSRVRGTDNLARSIAAAERRPAVWLAGSAIGWYGYPGDVPVDESGPNGEGFLPGVVRDWEAAIAPAEETGVRITRLRTGVVLSRHGGALGRMLPFARIGLAGPLGSGKQIWSWIAMADEVGAIMHLLETDVPGPVNLTAPNAVSNIELTRTLARRLRRPAIFPAPAFALRTILGGFAEDVLGSERIVPNRLLESGYVFQCPDIMSGIRSALR